MFSYILQCLHFLKIGLVAFPQKTFFAAWASSFLSGAPGGAGGGAGGAGAVREPRPGPDLPLRGPGVRAVQTLATSEGELLDGRAAERERRD